ncbi:BACON domain-containing protein [Catenibacterium sp.]|uniref:BACON domain-containing protein n=1 Tax=Catenibacterium sp. TaxID=2049022 RepID=UPI003AB52AB3
MSSKPSWITTSTTSSKVTISASDNSGSARSGKVVLTQSGSGNTLTVNVSQGAKPAENVYVFTITPNTYDAPYSSASFIPRTVSTKNGSNIGYSLTSGGTDWLVVSTTGKITVEILKNTTSNTRSTTLVFT